MQIPSGVLYQIGQPLVFKGNTYTLVVSKSDDPVLQWQLSCVRGSLTGTLNIIASASLSVVWEKPSLPLVAKDPYVYVKEEITKMNATLTAYFGAAAPISTWTDKLEDALLKLVLFINGDALQLK